MKLGSGSTIYWVCDLEYITLALWALVSPALKMKIMELDNILWELNSSLLWWLFLNATIFPSMYLGKSTRWACPCVVLECSPLVRLWSPIATNSFDKLRRVEFQICYFLFWDWPNARFFLLSPQMVVSEEILSMLLSNVYMMNIHPWILMVKDEACITVPLLISQHVTGRGLNIWMLLNGLFCFLFSLSLDTSLSPLSSSCCVPQTPLNMGERIQFPSVKNHHTSLLPTSSYTCSSIPRVSSDEIFLSKRKASPFLCSQIPLVLWI